MSEAWPLKSTLESLGEQPDQLIEIILWQAGVIDELRKEVEQLKQQIKDLNDRNDGLSTKVEQLARAAARQAAPFRIEDKDRMAQPKKPGRPKGQPGSFRAVPEQVDEEIMVPLNGCPECGGEAWGSILKSCRWCVRA